MDGLQMVNRVTREDYTGEREMCPWAISKYFGD
jgi:hypothetical protein